MEADENSRQVKVTALFAYVSGSGAIIAADTLRTDPLGFFPDQTVTKAYTWGTHVLFAQTGNGPALDRLAHDILLQSANFSADEAGFRAALTTIRPQHHAAALARNPLGRNAASLNRGTILVAVAEVPPCPAHIFRVDFATGVDTPCPANVAADGSDLAAFEQVANAVRSRLMAANNGILPGDVWASECIDEAMKLYPKAVGLPFDVAISASGSGGQAATIQRFAALITTADPAFEIS